MKLSEEDLLDIITTAMDEMEEYKDDQEVLAELRLIKTQARIKLMKLKLKEDDQAA